MKKANIARDFWRIDASALLDADSKSCRWEQELGCLQFFFEINLQLLLSGGRQLGPF